MFCWAMENPKHIHAQIVQPGPLNGTIECGYDKSVIVWYKICPIVWYLFPSSIRPRIEVCRQYGRSYLPSGPLLPTARGPDRSFLLPHMRQAKRCLSLGEMFRPLNDIQQAPTLTIVTSFHLESEALTPQSLSRGLMTRVASCHDCGRFAPVVRRMPEGFVRRSWKPWTFPFRESYRTRRGFATTMSRRTVP